MTKKDFTDVFKAFYSTAPYIEAPRREMFGGLLLAVFVMFLALGCAMTAVGTFAGTFYEFGDAIQAMPEFDIVKGRADAPQSPVTLTSRHGISVLLDTRQDFDVFLAKPPKDVAAVFARDGLVLLNDSHRRQGHGIYPFRDVDFYHVSKANVVVFIITMALTTPMIMAFLLPIAFVAAGGPLLLFSLLTGFFCAFILVPKPGKMNWAHGARLGVLLFLPGALLLAAFVWVHALIHVPALVAYPILAAILCSAILLSHRERKIS